MTSYTLIPQVSQVIFIISGELAAGVGVATERYEVPGVGGKIVQLSSPLQHFEAFHLFIPQHRHKHK